VSSRGFDPLTRWTAAVAEFDASSLGELPEATLILVRPHDRSPLEERLAGGVAKLFVGDVEQEYVRTDADGYWYRRRGTATMAKLKVVAQTFVEDVAERPTVRGISIAAIERR
jgi:hypothetical protein